ARRGGGRLVCAHGPALVRAVVHGSIRPAAREARARCAHPDGRRRSLLCEHPLPGEDRDFRLPGGWRRMAASARLAAAGRGHGAGWLTLLPRLGAHLCNRDACEAKRGGGRAGASTSACAIVVGCVHPARTWWCRHDRLTTALREHARGQRPWDARELVSR